MRICFLGDIAFFGEYSLSTNKSIIEKTGGIAKYLKSFDFVVGNLESPFSCKKKKSGAKSAYVCSDMENIKILKSLHVNAVSLANNHMFDYGKEGYELTKKVLEDAGIDWFGSEGKGLKKEIGNNKLFFVGFCCYTSNPLMCVHYGEYGVNAYNIEKAFDVIRKSNISGFLPILSVHAGTEHVNYPSVDHIRAARHLSNAGTFVYYGHHPHVVQGVEEYNSSLIAHSLGNFCFDDVYTDALKTDPLVRLTDNNRTGMILELTIEGNHIVDWREQAIHIGEDGKISLIEATASFKEYNEAVVSCENNIDKYIARRNAVLESRINERKAQRDLIWYMRRMRPRYFRLVFDMRRNQNLYNKNVKQFL